MTKRHVTQSMVYCTEPCFLWLCGVQVNGSPSGQLQTDGGGDPLAFSRSIFRSSGWAIPEVVGS